MLASILLLRLFSFPSLREMAPTMQGPFPDQESGSTEFANAAESEKGHPLT